MCCKCDSNGAVQWDDLCQACIHSVGQSQTPWEGNTKTYLTRWKPFLVKTQHNCIFIILYLPGSCERSIEGGRPCLSSMTRFKCVDYPKNHPVTPDRQVNWCEHQHSQDCYCICLCTPAVPGWIRWGGNTGFSGIWRFQLNQLTILFRDLDSKEPELFQPVQSLWRDSGFLVNLCRVDCKPKHKSFIIRRVLQRADSVGSVDSEVKKTLGFSSRKGVNIKLWVSYHGNSISKAGPSSHISSSFIYSRFNPESKWWVHFATQWI